MADVNSGILKDPAVIANKKEELEKWKTGYYNPETGEDYRGFDWYDNFVSKAAPQSYVNININGGTDNTTYYLSVGHVNQDAVFKDYNFNRTNMTANFNIDLTERLKVGAQVLGKIETELIQLFQVLMIMQKCVHLYIICYLFGDPMLMIIPII